MRFTLPKRARLNRCAAGGDASGFGSAGRTIKQRLRSSRAGNAPADRWSPEVAPPPKRAALEV